MSHTASPQHLPLTPRLLIVEQDVQYRTWLRHHLEILWPDATLVSIDEEQFEQRYVSLTRATHDAILFGTSFGSGPQEPCAGFDWLLRLRRRPSLPPVVVIAASGNELTAVRAIRLGAAQYLPRDLLNAALLGRTLRAVLRRVRRQAQLEQRQEPNAGDKIVPRRRRTRNAGDDQPPLPIPRFSLLHRLGESARATVWLARSEALDRHVALKVSKPPLEEMADHQLFAREYAAIAALRHPAIVDIYDYGVHEGREFIAMEYFPCGDLKQRLAHPITAAESVDYALRIGEALRVVHEAGMLHRDLKPPNVMLRTDGSIVLIDFGLAKRVGSTTQNTAVGVLRGSPYYMSPEQVQGLPLDPRSDLYSLGVVLYEMLTGRKPYLGTTAMDLMQQHVGGLRPPLPLELLSFEPVLALLMARTREDRCPDATAALEALSVLSANVLETNITPVLARAI